MSIPPRTGTVVGVLSTIAQDQLDQPRYSWEQDATILDAMGPRRQTVEHVFGALKAWMGSTPFLTRALKNVRTEISLSVLAYTMKRLIRIFGVQPLIQMIRV
jgi:hypothetical protein